MGTWEDWALGVLRRVDLVHYNITAVTQRCGTYPLAPFLRGRGNQGSPLRVGEGSKTQHDALHHAFRQNSREPVRNVRI